jgi:hypothetical protein
VSPTPETPVPHSVYAGKHRAAPAQTTATSPATVVAGPFAPRHLDRAKRVRKNTLRNVVGLSGLAAAATGAAVIAGLVHTPAVAGELADSVASSSSTAAGANLTKSELLRREAPVASRSFDRRTERDPAKKAILGLSSGAAAGPAVSGHETISQESPQSIAEALLPTFGFSSSQMSCLIPLWMGESGWRINAANPTSSAYGIPQALPGSKMASAGSDWQTSAVTQITWGLGYIRDRYGSPCGAWSFKQGHGFY